MLKLETPRPGLLFVSFLYRSDLHTEESLTLEWEKYFGPTLKNIPAFNPLADYYSKEMGSPLQRFFLASQKTFTRDYLLSAKLQMVGWENRWAQNEKRQVNIDVGFLTLENFILATTKNYSHRVFIGENIFADLTYQFQHGSFQMLPWTYPDYRDEKKLKFFVQLRNHLHDLLR